MNAQRRKAIDDLIADLEKLRGAFEDATGGVEAIKEEEEEYLENMPESMRDGDKGSVAQEAIDALDEACNALSEFDFDSVIGALENAKG